MERNHTVKLSNDQAFVAFSNPNEVGFALHLCDHQFAELSDENLELFDFLAMPFVSNIKLDSFFKYTKTFIDTKFSFFSKHQNPFNITSKSDYVNDVNSLIECFKETELNKAIYSRKITIQNDSNDLGTIFDALRLKYRNAFVFMYNIPGVGCWLGATPEVLLRKNVNVLTTVALAGTQKFSGDINDIVWGQKEVKEQAYIKNFVRHTYARLGISFKESETATKAAGEVCHIFTEFESELPSSISCLIKELHPGPAISGSPKDQAIAKVLKIEKHSRSFYTGYLGEIADNKLNLFINLRSMEVLEDNFLLYVGGGITIDSKVEDEWTETELKSKTMSSVIK